MEKDKRYLTVKRLIEAGHIKSFCEIFDNIPKSVVARDLGFNYNRLTRLIADVEGWVLRDLYELSKLFNIDDMVLLTLVHQQREIDRKVKRRKEVQL